MPQDWKGLPVDELCRIRHEYCNLGFRTALGGDEEKLKPRDRVGRLIRLIYKQLKEQYPAPFPKLTDLGNACEPAVKLPILNKFLNENAPSGTHWLKHARVMLRLMLVGSEPDTKSPEYAVYEYIDWYFLRKLHDKDSSRVSPFFRPERRTTDPWSRGELAGQIRHALHKHKATGWEAEMVWVSGGGQFFPEGVNRPVAEATAAAIEGGVRGTFAYHRTPAGVTAAELDEFFVTYQNAKVGSLTEIDLGRVPSATAGGSGFAHQTFQHLYLRVVNPDPKADPDDNFVALYTVRGHRHQRDARDRGQAALTAFPRERELFEEWLRDLRSRAAAPVEPPVGTDGEALRTPVAAR